LRATWFEYLYYVGQAELTGDHKEERQTPQRIEAGAKSILEMAKTDLDRLGKPI
jgi:hypothetical protein